MTLKELLEIIHNVAKSNGLATPYVCGGTPRDKLVNNIKYVPDIDITTGNSDINELGKKSATVLGNIAKYIDLKTHAHIIVGNFSVDLSTNYVNPHIINSKAPDIIKETYSRDFTCNALLMSTDLSTIYDPTKKGIKDINNKIIRTCLSVEKSLNAEAELNKRIVRAIYLASKLGFDIDPEIISWVKNHPEKIANCSQQFLSEKLSKAMKFDKIKTLGLLDQMGVWKYVPPIPELKPYIAQGRF